MSADNWAKCPRCAQKELAHLEGLQAAIDAAYGQVTIEEFDKMRAELRDERHRVAMLENTFREDFEAYGASAGVVTIRYKGYCTVRKCGLKLEFQEDHPIPGLT